MRRGDPSDPEAFFRAQRRQEPRLDGRKTLLLRAFGVDRRRCPPSPAAGTFDPRGLRAGAYTLEIDVTDPETGAVESSSIAFEVVG